MILRRLKIPRTKRRRSQQGGVHRQDEIGPHVNDDEEWGIETSGSRMDLTMARWIALQDALTARGKTCGLV
jgi:hypothetical protein